MDSSIFEKNESNVRSYCRTWPTIFDYAKGSIINDEEGKSYIDFFNGAGALAYGHNNNYINEKIIEYIKKNGIVHALDMYTSCKKNFLESFVNDILVPRNLDYKIMFCGPTGTNGNESALKLARKVKKRNTIFALMGAFHGMTLGSLALTTDECSRKGAGVQLNDVIHIPAPYMNGGFDTVGYLNMIMEDDHSGIDVPAAIMVETTQAEGGVYVIDEKTLQGIRQWCDKYDVLMIVDDVQVGVNRTGCFFSFERANIVPDIVVLSKAIGAGMPLALCLFKSELDIWAPGEHNGTFRGNQLSLVAAKAGLDLIKQLNVSTEVKRKENLIKNYLYNNIKPSINCDIRGIGCIWGIDVFEEDLSKKIVKKCFENGLILERAGRKNSVVKIMPSLVISDEELLKGLEIIKEQIANL